MNTALNIDGAGASPSFGTGLVIEENDFLSTNGTIFAIGGTNAVTGSYTLAKNYIGASSNMANCSNCDVSFRMDMTQCVFNGVQPGMGTMDDYFNVQASFTHQGKSSKPGLFIVRPKSLFVYRSSYNIANAVLHAQPGDTIFIDAITGTGSSSYWTEKVVINKDNLTFYGRQYLNPVSGRGTPTAASETKMQPSAGNDIAFTTSGAINKLTISGFSFNGGSGVSSRQGIVLASAVTDLTIENNLFNTFNSATKESFQAYAGSENVVFKNNRYFNSQKGPYYPNDVSGEIHNNIIPGVVSGTAIRLGGSGNDVQIYHNDLNGAGTGVAVLSGGGTDDLGNTSVYENNLAGRTVYFDNQRSVPLDNSCNWFGETVLGDINAKVSGNATVNSYLGSSANDGSIGFVPTGDCMGPVTVWRAGTLISSHVTIQDGIDASQNGDEVHVEAGTFYESVIVDKSVTIKGNNAGIDGNDNSRNPETVLYPTGFYGFNVKADNVTIDGFNINGANPNDPGYSIVNTGDLSNTLIGIYHIQSGKNNLIVENNIIENMIYVGVMISPTTPQANTAGHRVRNNLIKNLGSDDPASGYVGFGMGTVIGYHSYTAITDNVMKNVNVGIQTENWHQPNPNNDLADQLWARNNIEARGVGIYYNTTWGDADPFRIENNTITGIEVLPGWNAKSRFVGIVFSSLYDGGSGNNSGLPFTGIEAVNNVISGGTSNATNYTAGYEVWNVSKATTPSISGGSVTGVDYGVYVNNYSAYGNAPRGAHISVSDVSITTKTEGIGVYVLDSSNSTTHADVIADVSNNTINGAYQGVSFYENSPGTVGGTVIGNTIEAEWAGINIYNGMIVSGTHPLVIENNNVTMTGQLTPDADNLPTGGIVLRGISGDAPTVKNNNIDGAFGGIGVYNVNTTPVITLEGGTITGAMQGVVVVNLDPDNFADRAPSAVHIKDITMSNFAGNHPMWADADFHAGVYATTGGGDPSATVTVTADNLEISGTDNHSQSSAAYVVADWSGSPGMLNVTINESNIHDNKNRGIHVRGEGASVAVNESTFTNNGYDPYGVGFNDGYAIVVREGAELTALKNYITNPSSVANGYDVYALFTDGAGAGTATLTAHYNWLGNNGNSNGKLAFNLGDNGIWDVSCNWWGTTSVVDIEDLLVGDFNFIPYLVNDDINNPDCSGGPVTVWDTSDTFVAAYPTIQSAVDAVTTLDNYIVRVASGTYAENVVVDKSLDIRGANYGINPNTDTRVAESFVTFPAGSDGGDLFIIRADDVKVDGFTFDGQNNVTADGAAGVIGYGDRILVENNIVTNFSYISIWFSSYHPDYPTPSVGTFFRSDIEVKDNYIDNAEIFNLPDGSIIGYGIYMQGALGEVTGNVVKGTKTAIQVQPYKHPNTQGKTGLVSGNNFEGYREVIWYNAGGQGTPLPATSWDISNNNLTGIAPPTGVSVPSWMGLRLHSYKQNGLVFHNNNIDKGAAVPGLFISNTEGSPDQTLDATCNWYGTDDFTLISAGIAGEVTTVPFLTSGGSSTTIGFTPTGDCDGLPLIPVYAKVLLQGALINVDNADQYDSDTLMRDDIRSLGLLPINQPYGVVFGYGGDEEVTDATVFDDYGDDSIVDWILLELRDASNPATIVATRAALLQKDGDIVEVDGVSPVVFSVFPADYYLAVRHRNHFGTMSKYTLDFSQMVSFDFRTEELYSINGRSEAPVFKASPTGNQMLWGGNVNLDNRIVYKGQDSDSGALSSYISNHPNNGFKASNFTKIEYSVFDANMNGQSNAVTSGNDSNIIERNIMFNAQGNTFKATNYTGFYDNLP